MSARCGDDSIGLDNALTPTKNPRTLGPRIQGEVGRILPPCGEEAAGLDRRTALAAQRLGRSSDAVARHRLGADEQEVVTCVYARPAVTCWVFVALNDGQVLERVSSVSSGMPAVESVRASEPLQALQPVPTVTSSVHNPA